MEAESKACAEGAIKSDKDLPSFTIAVIPILIPIALIMLSTIWGQFAEVPEFVSMISSKEVAMLLGAFSAILLCKGRMTRDEMSASFENALNSAGTVLLTSGTGGFVSVLTAAVGGEVLTQVMQGSSYACPPFCLSSCCSY